MTVSSSSKEYVRERAARCLLMFSVVYEHGLTYMINQRMTLTSVSLFFSTGTISVTHARSHTYIYGEKETARRTNTQFVFLRSDIIK